MVGVDLLLSLRLAKAVNVWLMLISLALALVRPFDPDLSRRGERGRPHNNHVTRYVICNYVTTYIYMLASTLSTTYPLSLSPSAVRVFILKLNSPHGNRRPENRSGQAWQKKRAHPCWRRRA